MCECDNFTTSEQAADISKSPKALIESVIKSYTEEGKRCTDLLVKFMQKAQSVAYNYDKTHENPKTLDENEEIRKYDVLASQLYNNMIKELCDSNSQYNETMLRCFIAGYMKSVADSISLSYFAKSQQQDCEELRSTVSRISYGMEILEVLTQPCSSLLTISEISEKIAVDESELRNSIELMNMYGICSSREISDSVVYSACYPAKLLFR